MCKWGVYNSSQRYCFAYVDKQLQLLFRSPLTQRLAAGGIKARA